MPSEVFHFNSSSTLFADRDGRSGAEPRHIDLCHLKSPSRNTMVILVISTAAMPTTTDATTSTTIIIALPPPPQ